MFRFLVVEDDPHTLAQLKELLKEEFADAFVDTADTVEQGRELLKAAARAGQGYDAALLDFRLPSSLGENPEIDYSLCNEVRKMQLGTLVIHMTGVKNHPGIQKHLEESHSEPSDPWPFFVSKLDSAWGAVLLKRLKTFLFSKEIAVQMDDLFLHPSPAGSAARTAALRRPTPREGGVTHRLAVLVQCIEQHWPDLSETLKERIRATFVVDTVGNEVRVSLL